MEQFTPPLLYLNDDKRYELAIYLRNLIVTNTTDTAELSLSAGNTYYQPIQHKVAVSGIRMRNQRWYYRSQRIAIMMIYPFSFKNTL